MSEKLLREEMYDLVWTTPVKTLSTRFGMSDVALRKRCQKADIPLPQAGHWAKVRAGKRTIRPRLPARSPGMSEFVDFGTDYSWRMPDSELLGPIPGPPQFREPLELVRERCRKLVGAVRVAKDLSVAHVLIRKRLNEDDERREAQKGARFPSSWDAPRFAVPFEQRRLRILNALLLASSKAGGKPDVRGRKARDVSVRVNDQVIPILLESKDEFVIGHDEWNRKEVPVGTPMKLAFQSSYGSRDHSNFWEDNGKHRLESQIGEVVAEMLVEAERRYRERRLSLHEWRIEAKKQRLEEIRVARERAEQEERESQERLKQERVDRLMGDAEAFTKAQRLREFIATVEQAELPQTDPSTVQTWAAWARDVADGIDPLLKPEFGASLD